MHIHRLRVPGTWCAPAFGTNQSVIMRAHMYIGRIEYQYSLWYELEVCEQLPRLQMNQIHVLFFWPKTQQRFTFSAAVHQIDPDLHISLLGCILVEEPMFEIQKQNVKSNWETYWWRFGITKLTPTFVVLIMNFFCDALLTHLNNKR